MEKALEALEDCSRRSILETIDYEQKSLFTWSHLKKLVRH